MGLAVEGGGGRKDADGGGGNPPLGSVDVPGAPAAIRGAATPGGLNELGLCGRPGGPAWYICASS